MSFYEKNCVGCKYSKISTIGNFPYCTLPEGYKINKSGKKCLSRMTDRRCKVCGEPLHKDWNSNVCDTCWKQEVE